MGRRLRRGIGSIDRVRIGWVLVLDRSCRRRVFAELIHSARYL